MGIRELDALNTARLARDWTFQELADHMADAGCSVKLRTLYYLIHEMPRTATPNERTLFKIKKYLKVLHQRERENELARKRRQQQGRTAIGA